MNCVHWFSQAEMLTVLSGSRHANVLSAEELIVRNVSFNVGIVRGWVVRTRGW